MQTMKHSEGLWEIGARNARYAAAGDNADRLKAVGLPVGFDAMSIGSRTGQVAIVPLDESCIGNAIMLAAAPWYRILALIATSDECASIEFARGVGQITEGWLVRVGDKHWTWWAGVDPFGVPVSPPEAMFLEIKQAIESL